MDEYEPTTSETSVEIADGNFLSLLGLGKIGVLFRRPEEGDHSFTGESTSGIGGKPGPGFQSVFDQRIEQQATDCLSVQYIPRAW